MLHYAQSGQGQQLLLIHGFPNDMSTWEPILPALEPHFRITRVDLPGAGGSAAMPADQQTMRYMAEQVLATLKELNIERTLVAGHSMGGYTALELYALAPERISGLALVHSLAGGDDAEKRKTRQKSIKLLLNGEAGKRVFLEAMAQNLFGKKDSAALQAQIVRNGMRLSSESLAAFYTAIMNRSDKRHLLANLQCPIAYICGTEDNATPYNMALEECYKAPVASIDTLRGGGHMSMLEDADWLGERLLAFLNIC